MGWESGLAAVAAYPARKHCWSKRSPASRAVPASWQHPSTEILKLELSAHPALKTAVADCEACGDYVSRDLFRQIMTSEEDHIDWLETQLDLIDKVGVANYQQSQMGHDD
jgi:hypothetical protein